MGKAIAAAFLALSAFCASAPNAYAASALLFISDASLIKYEADASGKVYFRNLNDFDPAWAGCCYSHWMDISTDGGRAQYATFLSAFYSGKKLTIYGDPTGGVFSHVGSF